MKNDSKIVAELLKQADIFYLATSVNEQPHISIVNSVVEYNGKLYLMLHQSEIKQIHINPKIALLAIIPAARIIEIMAHAIPNTDETAFQQLLNCNPHLVVNVNNAYHDLGLIVLSNAEIHVHNIVGKDTLLRLE